MTVDSMGSVDSVKHSEKQALGDFKRTHYCGLVRESDLERDVVVMGWVHNRRDHGGCIFLDLRDREGLVQIVFDPHVSPLAHAQASRARSEWVLGVRGVVRSRGGNNNPRMNTGMLEISALECVVFAQSETTPFQIDDDIDTAEDVRLRYRYLDLRRPTLQRNLIRRHRFNQLVRSCLDEHGFLELETPYLIRSTPEGARDYVVPSRVHTGQFFALPQSPQLFKQLFMVAGYDRYFQIARCFRDEDLRAERQPEFTQVDLEMSFCTPEDVQNITEEMLVRVWRAILGVTLKAPFERITYDDAMARFGVDAPDMRFGLELKDVSDIVRTSGFKVFADIAQTEKGAVKAICVPRGGDISRKDLDAYTEFVKIYGAKGLAWVKVRDVSSDVAAGVSADVSSGVSSGERWQSPIAKFLTVAERDAIEKRVGASSGDLILFVADSFSVTHAALGNLRKHIAKAMHLIPKDNYHFCWVVDFPLYEWNAESGRYFAAHHPFTAPKPEYVGHLVDDPGVVKAEAYDIVLNGIEIGGGSLRIHDPDLQQEMFRVLGMSHEEQREKFGFLLDALRFGAPPHGGLALGVDRIMMLMCDTPSIRDVIAYPKTQKQLDLMLEAPSSLELTQLLELGLQISKRG